MDPSESIIKYRVYSTHEMYTILLNIAHEPKGIGMKTKRIWVGYMIKFVIRATWVSKSFHLKRYTHSC
jgi:hypothetical protein